MSLDRPLLYVTFSNGIADATFQRDSRTFQCNSRSCNRVASVGCPNHCFMLRFPWKLRMQLSSAKVGTLIAWLLSMALASVLCYVFQWNRYVCCCWFAGFQIPLGNLVRLLCASGCTFSMITVVCVQTFVRASLQPMRLVLQIQCFGGWVRFWAS